MEEEGDSKSFVRLTKNQQARAKIAARIKIKQAINRSSRKKTGGSNSGAKKPSNIALGTRTSNQPKDMRTCNHGDKMMCWTAQGKMHIWKEERDMARDPNKEAAVRNIVYGISKLAVHTTVQREYVTWPYDWRAAVAEMSDSVVRRARSFKDVNFPYIVANHVPYALFSIDGTYFTKKILTDDFVPLSNNNPAFKTRLTCLLANVVWKSVCHTCQFYYRTIIKQAERNWEVPDLHITLTCMHPVCNLKLYAVFKSCKPDKDGKVYFEVFSERFRTLSVLPAKGKANNSHKTFVAGECGRCMVDKYVQLVPGQYTPDNEIAQFVRPAKRAAFEAPVVLDADSSNIQSPFDHSVNLFDVYRLLDRFNRHEVPHKEAVKNSTEIGDLMKVLGFENVRADEVYKAVCEGFVRYEFGSPPYLDSSVVTCLGEPFASTYFADTSALMQSFYSAIQNAHPNIRWPQPYRGTPTLKQELADSDSDENGRVSAAIETEPASSGSSFDHEASPASTPPTTQTTNQINMGFDPITSQSDIKGYIRVLDNNPLTSMFDQPSGTEEQNEEPFTGGTQPFETEEPEEQIRELDDDDDDEDMEIVQPTREQNTDTPEINGNQTRTSSTAPPVSILTQGSETPLRGRLERPSGVAQLSNTPLERLMIPVSALANKSGQAMIVASDFLIFNPE